MASPDWAQFMARLPTMLSRISDWLHAHRRVYFFVEQAESVWGVWERLPGVFKIALRVVLWIISVIFVPRAAAAMGWIESNPIDSAVLTIGVTLAAWAVLEIVLARRRIVRIVRMGTHGTSADDRFHEMHTGPTEPVPVGEPTPRPAAEPQPEINVRLISGGTIRLRTTGEMRATLAISSPDTLLKKCSVRLVKIEAVSIVETVTGSVQTPYLQWSEGEPGAYGPNREYLDIAAIPDDEHIVDVAITALPAGFKAVRFGDDAKEENLPTWWFHLGSATEQRDFYQGWYKATLQIAAEGNASTL